MTQAEAIQRGRASIADSAWHVAFSQLSEADLQGPMEPEDVERLAGAAHLIGRDSEANNLLARAHQGYLISGQTSRAVRCAVWLSIRLLFNGEPAQAGGWLARARRLLEGHTECVEHGYVLMPEGLQSFHSGQTAEALEIFSRAADIGMRFEDKDLVTLALQAQGRARIRAGDFAYGLSLLDEAMVAVTAGDVSPVIVGTVYCSVIESCNETLDMRRAHEWTSALNEWCASQPEANPFRGSCLLHRAEVLQFRGAWREAMAEAQLACERLAHPSPKPSLGAAFYRAGELHRVRGEFAEAEQAFRNANQCGYEPQPGLSLLRLAQGKTDAAVAGVRIAVKEARNPVKRAFVLAALIEIILASGDLKEAQFASAELKNIAENHGAPLLSAVSSSASGAVLISEGDYENALSLLREARKNWSDLEAPYEAARARVLIAIACRSLGDCDTSDMEFAAASQALAGLGAVAELERLKELFSKQAANSAGPLSAREVEVLKQIASGATNRNIAGSLGISEKTVARHVSNIFMKLDLNSRAAATAYAFRKGLA